MPHLVINLRDVRPLWALPPWALEEIRGALPPVWEVRVVDAPADGRGDGGEVAPEVLDAARGAEIYVGFGIPRALFLAATDPPEGRLRWVHSASAGVGGSLYPEMQRSDVLLTNSAGIHAAPIAETVLAMILHFARGLDFAVRAQAERRWDKQSFNDADTPVGEIAGATVGIVGFGGIGREVAQRATALGMRVLASRRREADAPDYAEVLVGPGSLDVLLERSDFLVIAVPETDETRGMIGALELERMRPGAVLVNVSRGAALDEPALVEALRSGRLRGAALDVFQHEPLPSDSPLWDLPNVLLTPHMSGTSRGFWRRETDLIVHNIGPYLAGEPLLNMVDKQAGY